MYRPSQPALYSRVTLIQSPSIIGNIHIPPVNPPSASVPTSALCHRLPATAMRVADKARSTDAPPTIQDPVSTPLVPPPPVANAQSGSADTMDTEPVVQIAHTVSPQEYVHTRANHPTISLLRPARRTPSPDSRNEPGDNSLREPVTRSLSRASVSSRRRSRSPRESRRASSRGRTRSPRRVQVDLSIQDVEKLLRERHASPGHSSRVLALEQANQHLLRCYFDRFGRVF